MPRITTLDKSKTFKKWTYCKDNFIRWW